MMNKKHVILNINRRLLKTIMAMLLMAVGTTTVWGQNPSTCEITVTVDNTSAYTPTQIANGDFSTRPYMPFKYNGTWYNEWSSSSPNTGTYWTAVNPNGIGQGWNTTETQVFEHGLFEWINHMHIFNNNVNNAGHDYFLEMNACNSAVLYQDLPTNGHDVIRWSLDHAVRLDCGANIQSVRVEVGAPEYSGANIVAASGVNNDVNSHIQSSSKVIYRSSGITNPSNATYGFNGSNLGKLSLSQTASSDNASWHTVTGVYVIPSGQAVTRFGFIAEVESDAGCGNLLDNLTFSTLIGNMTATYGTNNSVIISGYWGDTDASKKLVVNVGNQTFNVDMSGVIGQNFTVTIPGSCIGTNFTGITFYHEDYPSASRTISVNLPITATAADVNVTYDGAAHGITPVVTVPANNYTIKYGTSYGGCSSSSSPTYINAGDYTVYYQVSAEHYSTFIGSATVSISKAASSVVTPPTPGVGMEYLNSNISLLTTGGTASGGNMVYALGTNATTPTTSGYSTNIPTGKSWGNYYVWYKVQGDANHNDSDPGVVVASIAEPPTYAVTVSVRETGLGSVGINNNYNVSSANIHAHDNVTINATPASGLSFVRWTDGNGSQKSTSNNYNATITEAIDFVADFGYNVSVTKIGNGTIQMNYTDIDNVSQTTGEVTNNTQRYTHSGSEVTLTATPDAHYHFKYWTNNLNDQKVTTNTFTFAPSATVTYTAVFAVDTHNVTIAANDLTKGGVFVKQVVLTEGFESGNMPDGWTSNEYEWTVVSANGQTGTYCIKNGNSGNHSTTSTLSVSINFVGEGSISFRSRVSSESYWDVGRFIIDDVEKFSRSGPEGWMEDNYVVPAGTHTFAWSYSKDGSVNSNDDAFYVDDIVIKDFASASTEPYRYTYGQTCDILAVPEEYCYFENWTDENDHVVGTAASKSFTVTGDTTLAANFAINSYTITATANPMAAGTITGAGNYNHNAPCSLTASPATGYHFVNWTEGETVVSTDATYNFTVTGARTLTANFQLNSYTITFNSNGGSAVASITQNYGTSVIAPANPTRTGYTFAGWDPAVPATMPAENTECNATWTPIDYILTDIPDGWTVTANGQTVTPNNGEASIPCGATVVLTPPDSVKPRVKDVELLTPEQIPLTFEAMVDNATVTFTKASTLPDLSIEYSKNGEEWTAYSEPITLNIGEKVSFRGDNTTYATSYNNDSYSRFSCTNQCYVFGNIMSLINSDTNDYATNKTLEGAYAFCKLFFSNNNIYSHASKELILPATTLSAYCYDNMFYQCSNLTNAPVLPATTLTDHCYFGMFMYCHGITTAPELPAKTLAPSCYYQMFAFTNIIATPELPAKTLATSCYKNMFQGCTYLTTATALPATTLASNCYSYMFIGCSNLTTAPELPATMLENNCYNNMFKNCTHLNKVTCLATDISATGCTTDWLDGVAGTGTFYKPTSMTTWPTNNVNGIPPGWTEKPSETFLPFTINGSGDQVYFSQGNLRYTSGAWSFFDNQWDYYATYSADSWDKFGWSTSATTYGMSTSENNPDYSGDFVDWGATIGSGWRTLTLDEWTYVFNTRTSGSTVNGTSDARYTEATINTDGTSVNGMILFPDGITVDAGEATSWGNINSTSDWGTKCTSAQWTALAAKGCVFLPTAGNRSGTTVNKAGSQGHYRSSTPSGSDYAYYVLFYSGYLTPSIYNYRHVGYSVRLVRDAN